MSYSGKPTLEPDTLADHLRDSLGVDDVNKPDFRELELGSPVSPLRTRPSGVPTTSSSSSSSGSVTGRSGSGLNPAVRRPEVGHGSHFGELSGSTENSPTAGGRHIRSGQVRSDSGTTAPLIYSGQSSVTSPVANVLPAGNICPSGRVLKTGMSTSRSSRTDVLGSGSGNYGHGSIMRGSSSVPKHPSTETATQMGARAGAGHGGDTTMKKAMASSDPEEAKRIGNDLFKKGQFREAINLYDRAIALSPKNPAYRSNKAAALAGLDRIREAVRECQEAVKLDPNYGRARQRLGSLLLRMGQLESARMHLCFPGLLSDPNDMQKLKVLENHISKCGDARKVSDWRTALKEADGAIAAGADFCPQLFMCRVEALFKLHQLDDAESALSNVPKVDPLTNPTQTRVLGMLFEAYPFFVKAQVEMALGRFDSAVAAAEKAGQIDPRNHEVSTLLNKVKLVTRARARGNDLFKSERYTEACAAYAEGLKHDPSNSVLYCNRAACWSKLGNWKQSIEDCNQALLNQPNYAKALLRRAASNSKLERWAEAVMDYEALRKKLPDNNEVAESLFHAQIALKKSRGEEVFNIKFGGEVEEVTKLEQFKSAISFPGISIVHFNTTSDSQCKQIAPFVDKLCKRYPSVNFLKVDISKCCAIAEAENVRFVPTFKIYKDGSRVKEIVCPSFEMLEQSVRHYSL